MYESLNLKIKDYSENEAKLLTNVRNTILSTYEKSEKTRNIIETKLKKCNDREESLKAASNETIKFYVDLNDKIKKEVDDLKIEMERLNK
jgi:predicted transcriptional regulator